MKQFRLVFLIFIVILYMAFDVSAQIPSSSDTLKFVNGSGFPGQEVGCSISLVNSFEVGGFSCRIVFDETSLSVGSVSLTERTSFMNIFVVDTTEIGVLSVSASSFFVYHLPVGSGDIVDVSFNVNPDAQVGTYPVEFEDSSPFTYDNQLSDTIGIMIIPILIDGEIEVLTPTYVEDQSNTPENYQLMYNYPNPFNNRTSIAFHQFDYGTTTLEIYNIKGDRIKTIELGALSPGNHIASWNGRNYYNKEVASGVYSYALFVNNMSVLTNKMVLLK
ncbi:MAG: hypothetical protein GY839_10555 [candidate division Zixibacteria bacterium]|nr:hypothetical protein [candidate division Zixibacteria bacterium]